MNINKNIEFNSKIIGVASVLPEKVVTNDMLAEIVDTDDKWIRKRTGIRERRVVQNESCTSLAKDAALGAIKHAGIKANDVDIIVGATVTADYSTPSMASLVQKEIGCENAVSFDVSAGCTGFIYAVTVAASMMQSLNLETAIVVSSEVLTTRADWEDRSTCVLFGDGAGAVVLKRSEDSFIKHPILNAIPDTNDVLYIKNKKQNNPWSDVAYDDINLAMNGRDVFEFACLAMENTIKDLQKIAGEDKIDKVITHQANSRIIKFAANNTSIDSDRFFINVDKYANTSSATIPIALEEANENGFLQKGDNVALVGFGAGLTYGGIVIKWDI